MASEWKVEDGLATRSGFSEVEVTFDDAEDELEVEIEVSGYGGCSHRVFIPMAIVRQLAGLEDS